MISPKTVLDIHLGYTRYVYLRTPLSEGINLDKFGPAWAALTPDLTYTNIPTPCVSQVPGDDRWGNGSFCPDGTGSGIGANDDTYSLEPMVTHLWGSHNFKFGGEYRLLRNNYYQSNDPAGLFQFDAGMTSANPNNGQPGVSSGIGMASFLLGYGSSGSTTEPAKTADQVKYAALYVNDTWQASKKLTLNLGVRGDFQGDWTERYNRIVVFNPTETSPMRAKWACPVSRARTTWWTLRNIRAALPFQPGTPSARVSVCPISSIRIPLSGPDTAYSIPRSTIVGMMRLTTFSSIP
jgi:outer membrane receptor protein involved in Fe transport